MSTPPKKPRCCMRPMRRATIKEPVTQKRILIGYACAECKKFVAVVPTWTWGLLK